MLSKARSRLSQVLRNFALVSSSALFVVGGEVVEKRVGGPVKEALLKAEPILSIEGNKTEVIERAVTIAVSLSGTARLLVSFLQNITE